MNREMRQAILPNISVPKRCVSCGKGWFAPSAVTSCPSCGGKLSVAAADAILGKNEGVKKWLTH